MFGTVGRCGRRGERKRRDDVFGGRRRYGFRRRGACVPDLSSRGWGNFAVLYGFRRRGACVPDLSSVAWGNFCGSLQVSQAGRLRKTIDFIFLHGEGNWGGIVWLGVASLVFCVLQFGFGRWLGARFGDKISGGQLLGQKNTAMGIWMAGYYLTPLASVFWAFYSVFQNVWNSWQM